MQNFSVANELERWEGEWPAAGQRPVVKVIYDRASAELRVVGKWGSEIVEKTFPVEVGITEALKRAKAFIAEQTR